LNKGQVYIAARQITNDYVDTPGLLALHASTVYFDAKEKEWTTFSAFEEDGFLVNSPGDKKDDPSIKGMIIKAIVDTNGKSTNAYIQDLTYISNSYKKNVAYAAVPSLTENNDDRNSNGYVSGMHKKAGGTFLSYDGENVRTLPGFSAPVAF